MVFKMNIAFEKANLNHLNTIFQWLDEPHMKEFWDNTQAHKDDIVNFVHGRKEPSSYFEGVFVYWMGSLDGDPFCFILTGDVNRNEEWPDLWRSHFSKTGTTTTLDFGIGNKEYLGKKLAAPTLRLFSEFYRTHINPKTDTFLIDPDENNPKAYHVYEKAGFIDVGQFISDSEAFDGQKTHLMVKTMNRIPLDTYKNLCTQVYDLSKPLPPQDAYAFYRSYAAEAKGPILEPMCGTGRFLLPLIQEGFDIEGFDASPHMLTALQEKATLTGIKTSVWQGFIEDLDRPTRYRLIYIPSGSFGLISDLNTAQLALKKLYDHLQEGGLFVMEGETPRSVPPLGTWKGNRWPRADGTTILTSQLTLLEGSVCWALLKYELIKENQIVQTEVEQYAIRVYEPEELLTLLKETGFKEVTMRKAFDRKAIPDHNDEVIVYECRK